MKRLTTILLLTIAVLIEAQTPGEHIKITLNTGAEHVGNVRFANDQVVVLVDDRGQVFQYTRESIRDISPADAKQEAIEEERSGKVGAEIALMGGIGNVKATSTKGGEPYGTVGCVDADLFVGHKDFLQRHIFLGGGLGYHMLFVKDGSWMLLPIMARVSLPFLPDRKVSPFAALNAGYAFAIGSKDKKESDGLKGGALGELNLGAQFMIRGRKQLSLAWYGRLQGYQSKNATDRNGDVDYSYSGHHTQFTTGIRLSVML